MPQTGISDAARERAELLLRQHIRDPVDPSSQEVRGLVYSLEADRTELETEIRRLVERRSRIEEARNRYSDLYESAPLGYLLISDGGRIRDLNHTFADLVGVDRESLEGTPLAELVAADDRHTLDAHLRACRHGNTRASAELKLQADTDRQVPVQLHTVPDHASDEATGTHGYRMAVMDITELLQGREEKERMRQRLQHLEKLQSLVTMAGGVAHDFNNILTIIQGYAGLVRSELADDSPGRKHCSEILGACKRAAELSSQMLAFAGQWDRTIQRQDPADVVRGMQSLVANVVSSRAPVEYALSEDLPSIDIDVARIRQAILNLVTNAVEALTPHRPGRIRIAASRAHIVPEHAETMVWGDQLQEGDYVVFEVSDDGCGMDEATVRQMFDPFFSTKFAGRGLGLCSVLGIVRAHNGGLNVVSTPENGTTVMIYVPVTVSPESPGIDGPINGNVELHSNNVVLIADDESHILHIVKQGLSRWGFKVLTARDGAHAVEVFEKNKSTIDAVLLDMTMPRMNGREAFRRIKALKADVPIVLTSGYAENEAMRDFDEEGLAGFIPKPFAASDVVRTLRAVLESR